MPRLFVAVWSPDEVLRELAAMPRPEVDDLRWTKPERLHITLRFLGQCDEAEATAALRRVSLAPIRVTLGRGRSTTTAEFPAPTRARPAARASSMVGAAAAMAPSYRRVLRRL